MRLKQLGVKALAGFFRLEAQLQVILARPKTVTMPDREEDHLMTKVLYVEDHEAQRDIMVQMLELYGYEVDVASNGEEGVKKAQEGHPDIVLMDIRMPGRIDGLVAIRQLRSGSDTADIPIIVVSAWGSAKHKERAISAGADAHFTKPVTMDELIAAINRHLK
jgi:CheY-like chemotaxis protein